MKKVKPIQSPCHGCTEPECPCEEYDSYLEKLFAQEVADAAEGETVEHEMNEVMEEIRVDSPSPILQGKEEDKK